MQWLTRFNRDTRGLAAIEFAMLAPVMLVLYFGMVEFSQAYMANRRANHTASIVADLVAQGETTSKTELARVFGIGTLVMKPFDPSPLSIRVTSVTMDKNGKAIIDWSRANGTHLTGLKKGDPFGAIPSGVVGEGQTLIIGESYYRYTSNLNQVIKKPLAFQRTYYLRPRSTEKVPCTDC